MRADGQSRSNCTYKDHVINEEVRAKIQQAIGQHEDLLTIVKRRKLQWYMVMSPFIRSSQNNLARHSEREKTRQTEEEVRKQHQGMDRSGARQVPEGSGEQGKMEGKKKKKKKKQQQKLVAKIFFCAPKTLAVKG